MDYSRNHFASRQAIPAVEDPFEHAVRPPRAPAPWQVNTQQAQAPGIFANVEGESELDPTPAFMRLGGNGYNKIDGR
jgi:hypothetical protein